MSNIIIIIVAYGIDYHYILTMYLIMCACYEYISQRQLSAPALPFMFQKQKGWIHLYVELLQDLAKASGIQHTSIY